MKMRASLAALALSMLSNGAGATSICRWVNERGQTQIGEVAPEKYRATAICTDSQQFELSAQQRQAAERRVAAERARARQSAADSAADRASGAPQSAKAASAGARRPAERITDATDCRSAWRIYDESVECIGPYRTARGATKPEGFEKCTVVASPEPRCGPRSR